MIFWLHMSWTINSVSQHIFTKHPHTRQALRLGTGDRNTSLHWEGFAPGGFQGFSNQQDKFSPKVCRTEFTGWTTLPSHTSQLVYMQETRAVLRNHKWQVLCHRLKKSPGTRMGSCIKLGGVCPATRKEVTKAGSPGSPVLFDIGGLSSDPVSVLGWVTGSSSVSQSCPSPTCRAELMVMSFISRWIVENLFPFSFLFLGMTCWVIFGKLRISFSPALFIWII